MNIIKICKKCGKEFVVESIYMEKEICNDCESMVNWKKEVDCFNIQYPNYK